GDRVHGEVARRQVLLDRLPVQGGEVDRVAAPEGDAPGAVPLGEGEDRAAGQARVETGRELGVGAGDVDVHDVAAEELVANGSPDDPRGLDADRAPDVLIHRAPAGPRGAGRG